MGTRLRWIGLGAAATVAVLLMIVGTVLANRQFAEPTQRAAAATVTRVISSATPVPSPTPPQIVALPTATARPASTPTAAPAPTINPSPTATVPAVPTAVRRPPAPTPAATHVPPAAAAPAAVDRGPFPRLRIPSIGVNAYVESVGLTAQGAMAVPQAWQDVAWYDLGTTPGNVGNAVIDGHLDSTVAPAVFWYLSRLPVGGHIFIDSSAQKRLDFVVTDKESYPYNRAPLARIFGPASQANLNLITCNGSWDFRRGAYSDRLIVYTTLVSN